MGSGELVQASWFRRVGSGELVQAKRWIDG
ncbi:MAG: hypothetical protein ACI9G1_006005, partial [Pirellulaceae bacterium]